MAEAKEHGSFGIVPKPLAFPLYWKYSTAQTRMPPVDKIERVLQDRVKVWEKVFAACPDMTNDLQIVRRRTLAEQYARAAFASYAWKNWDSGKKYLALAIDIDEETWSNGAQLGKLIIDYGIAAAERDGGFDSKQLKRYVQGLYQSLPSSVELSTQLTRRVLGQLYAEAAYRAHMSGNSADVWRYTWRAIRADPGLFRNSGMLRRMVVRRA